MNDSAGNSKSTLGQDLQPGAPYKKGDFIGQRYEVYGIIGKGGFGVVYLVYSIDSHGTGEVHALKTFQDQFLVDQEVRKRFHKEASVWVELGRHPYLVHAYFVDEISGRLYIDMEYIAPNKEGLNSLDGYLLLQQPDLAQSLRWAIQICYGMEYAYSKGVRAHRDLKPANIMITQERIAKITDFGLAGVLREFPSMGAAGLGASGLSGQTMLGTGFGTPTHMAPEQFDNAAGCDERSDIYSFGVVLYQMATGGQVPFPIPTGADWQVVRQLHRESPVPQLDSPLLPIIQRCLEKSPEKRYQTFKEVRNNLEPLLQHETGEVIIPPQSKELEAWEWSNKGVSLAHLSRHEESIFCFDKALALDPCSANAWMNKGSSLNSLGRNEESILCFDKALALGPRNAAAWTNKGNSLSSLGRDEEAILCFDKALELDLRNAAAWTNKGGSLHRLGRDEEAIRCFDKALELDLRNAAAWTNKGNSLNSLGCNEAAICCFDKALALDPRNVNAWTNRGNSLDSLGCNEAAVLSYDKALALDPRNANAWTNKGNSLRSLGRYEESIFCCDKALEFDLRNAAAWTNKGNSLDNLGRDEEAVLSYDKALEFDPRHVNAWTNKGNSLAHLGRPEEAILCFDKALALDPRYTFAWNNKGSSLNSLGHHEEAILCFDKALALDPRHVNAWTNKGTILSNLGRYEESIDCFDKALEVDPRNANAWFNKALAEDTLTKSQEAIHSYQQFLALAAAQQYAKPIEYARKRLQELGDKRLSFATSAGTTRHGQSRHSRAGGHRRGAFLP